MRQLRVLGIETSCDETAAAVLCGAPGAEPTILAHRLLTQTEEHAPYGGVVPEIAARSHVQHLDHLVNEAMDEAGLGFENLDGIAATAGPGLIGGVIVGLMTAKAIALAHNKPLIAVNHLEGHALSVRLSEPVPFPYLLLLVSGGHCQLLGVKGPGDYKLYGSTIDDAVGEAFDKTAKLIGLGYPGGPAVEKAAKKGAAKRFKFPLPLKGRPGADFSFSGLKTAVRTEARKLAVDGVLCDKDIADLTASFQYTVGEVIVDRTQNAMDLYEADMDGGAYRIVTAGGVAANTEVRARLEGLASDRGYSFHVPPFEFCTDNGAMIAWAGIERLAKGQVDSLNVAPRARWPLAG
jgi:tRNA N6-adenosine threonylcarbamoyltransferase